jgi:hypothetical protein
VAVSGHKGQIVVTSFKDIFCIIFLLKWYSKTLNLSFHTISRTFYIPLFICL